MADGGPKVPPRPVGASWIPPPAPLTASICSPNAPSRDRTQRSHWLRLVQLGSFETTFNKLKLLAHVRRDLTDGPDTCHSQLWVRRRLTQRFRSLNLALQQPVDQRAHVFASLLRGFRQARLHFGVKIDWQVRLRAGAIELATFGFREVVFSFHIICAGIAEFRSWLLCASEMMRQRALGTSSSRHV